MLDKIKESFNEVLNAPLEKVTIETTIDNLHEWDSMKHMELIMSLENKFDITFEINEIVELNSVKKIIDTIGYKLKQ